MGAIKTPLQTEDATQNTDFMRIAVETEKQSVAEDERFHPKVGAVLVKDNSVLASAYRGELGAGDHAEYTLLEKKLAGQDVRGTTLFTTLEPCVARSKKRPCSDWVIEKGISRVFIGMLDPNPRIYNQGATKLRENGVQIHFFPPELRDEIKSDNRAFIEQFRANPAPQGVADFDYTNNDGSFTIGSGDHIFETRWSKASDVSIHIYNDSPSVEGVAIALNITALEKITDASVYDMTSRYRLPREKEFVVLKNVNGYFAALEIIDIKDRTRSDSHDQIVFRYWILTDKGWDFSSIKPV